MKGLGKTLCVALAMLVLVVAAGSAASAQDPGGRAAATVKRPAAVKIVRTSQRALLRKNRAVLRVRAPRAGKAFVSLRARALRRGAKPRRVARRRSVVFARAGSRKIRLTLTPLGRRLVKSCARRRLVARLVVRGGGRRIGPKRARRSLRRDRPICTGSGPQGPNPEDPDPQPYRGEPIPTADGERCDWLDPSVCLYPFPNDRFTVADPDTDTGRRVNFNLQSMPRNRAGKPVEPEEFNRNDGFSPGAMLITKVPGLNSQGAFAKTGAVPQTDIARYADPGQPVVVINAATGKRHPVWAEIDSNPDDPQDVTLIVRPARNFEEGTRYLVALRSLRNADGDLLRPADAFRVYRDRLITNQPQVEARRPEMERIIGELQSAGVRRANLYLAWEFTVASERNLTERMLHIRDDAFSQLGDEDLSDLRVEGDSPAFTIDEVEESPGDPQIARTVTGSVQVPCYMTLNCAPDGATYNYGPTGPVPPDPDALPQQAGTMDASFTCRIPRSAVDGPTPDPARPSLYGHGLLGSQGEVGGGNISAMAAEHGFVFCATDWYGFATTNLPNIAAILQDISRGPLLFDETQQGMLNFLYLGRAMIHPDGFVSDPAFQVGPADDSPVIDTERLFYDGNSQGGILGGSLAAVAPDFERAVLGVPGMNYSTLLRRSVDFEPYAEGEFGEALCEVLQIPPELCLVNDTELGLYDNYPDELERPLIFALLQMLWDRAEANGYAHHMTDDPLENTPAHQILLHVAFGDHQVANVTAEVEARTIGAGVYEPALDPGRHSDSDPFFGIGSLPLAPGPNPTQTGSALVYWDGGPFDQATRPEGTATPPAANVPPRPDQGYGADPHSYPRSDPKARLQKSHFLRIGGSLFNPCYEGVLPAATPTPCYAHGYTGP